ncbi:unnamed protein product [Durusdinium trenchii]|uniref:WWE domain-containing protein n=1 Tax=Durusdinium trenchii TaxID=1381693 RepID=A0ABP0RQ79_9DINO
MSFKRRKLPWAPADPVAAGRGGAIQNAAERRTAPDGRERAAEASGPKSLDTKPREAEERAELPMPRAPAAEVAVSDRPEGGVKRSRPEAPCAAEAAEAVAEHAERAGYAAAAASERAAVWEFRVKDGFKAFDATCQGLVESLYQAFLAGGDRLGHVPFGKQTILVDFIDMKQRLEGGARERQVRRAWR